MTDPLVSHDTDKAQFWDDHYSQWQSSGLSQKSYCREHDLSHRQFLYWRTRHNRLQQSNAIPISAVPVDLVNTVSVSKSATVAQWIELQLGAAVVRLPTHTSPQFIAQLIHALP